MRELTKNNLVMPENWPEYDLVVDLNGELKKVSVITRTTSKKDVLCRALQILRKSYD